MPRKDAFVRVRLSTGAEASMSPQMAKRLNLTPLDKPATRAGTALPAKNNPLKKKSRSTTASGRKKGSDSTSASTTDPSTTTPAGTVEKEN